MAKKATSKERLQIYMSEPEKQRLEEAAATRRLKLNDWALSVLLLEADRILDGEEKNPLASLIDMMHDDLSDKLFRVIDYLDFAENPTPYIEGYKNRYQED